MFDVDATAGELGMHALAVRIVPDDADVFRAQSHGRARAECGGRLTTARDEMLADLELRGRAVGPRKLRQPVNVIDRVRSDADDVEEGTDAAVHTSRFSLLGSCSGSVHEK
jgi:hypothetical protein